MKVTLEESKIRELIAKPGLVQQFPFLAQTITHQGCCRNPTRIEPHYENIRQHLAALPADQKQLFKKAAFGEDHEVTLFYKDGHLTKEINF
jgi:hypothetical protein